MYEQSISVMVNATSSMIKHAIDVLDADVSDLDPNVVALSVVGVPILVVFASVFVSWFQKCRCCCFCCFGRRLVPNTDAKEDIIGDEEFDAEAVHTDPTIPSDSDALNPKKHIDSGGADGADDGIAPTSPPATESSEDDMEEEDEEDELKPENRV
jgi:hypothetical protein